VSGEPESLTPPWAYYRRTGLTITRALTEGRDPGGYVARNPKNHADQWYVAQAYFNENLEPADTPARDDAAELRAALEAVYQWLRSEFAEPDPTTGEAVEAAAREIWETVCAALAASR